jgi:NifU-like protein involved in Fe-S cluster formation
VSKVIEHFLNPRNCGDLESPDGVGIEHDNPWFISIRVAIKVADGRIADIRFKTAGCVTAVASVSALTELVRQRPLEDALATTSADIVDALGSVPKEKLHCCDLAVRSLRSAIWNYRLHQEESLTVPGVCALQ